MLKIKNNNHLYILTFINALFFSGYLVLKFPLAYILHQHGLSHIQAYSLTTTATILFAVISIFLGVIFRSFHHHRFLIGLSMLLILSAIILLSRRDILDNRIAVSLYVVGGAIYFFCITLLLNKQFFSFDQRLSGNFINQVILNMGACVGIIFFVYGLSYGSHATTYSMIAVVFSFLLLCVCARYIKDDVEHWKTYLYVLCMIAVLQVGVYYCLQEGHYLRGISTVIFCAALLAAVFHAVSHRKKEYLNFIIFIVVFSFPYWTANVIFYNQFFFFLSDHVSGSYGLPPTLALLFDPVGNVLFGICYMRFVSDNFKKSNKGLYLGLALLFLAFFILFLSLYLSANHASVSMVFPIVALLVFACAQFLIQTIMSTKVSLFLTTPKSMNFGLGLLRSVRVLGAVVGYYLITRSHGAVSLYFSMLVFLGCGTILLLLYQFYSRQRP